MGRMINHEIEISRHIQYLTSVSRDGSVFLTLVANESLRPPRYRCAQMRGNGEDRTTGRIDDGGTGRNGKREERNEKLRDGKMVLSLISHHFDPAREA